MDKLSSEDREAGTFPLLHWIYVVAGFILVVIGIVLFWLPIPIGIPLMFAGLVLIVRFSPRAGGWIVSRMQRSPRLSPLVRYLRGYNRPAAESED